MQPTATVNYPELLIRRAERSGLLVAMHAAGEVKIWAMGLPANCLLEATLLIACYESKPLNCWLPELRGAVLLGTLRLAALRDDGAWVTGAWVPDPARLPLLLLVLMPQGALEPSLTCRDLASAAACLAAACRYQRLASGAQSWQDTTARTAIVSTMPKGLTRPL